MPVIAAKRFLVKFPAARLETLRANVLTAETMPLYPEEGQALASDALARQPDWFLHTPASDAQLGEHPWDAAHAVARQFKSAALAEEEAEPYVEPDLLHQHYVPMSYVVEGPVAPAGAWPAQKGLDPLYPPGGNDNFILQWHLDRARFPAAWDISTGTEVRIAHLDTGYYPGHCSTPRNMLRKQGWNYVEDNVDTTDPGDHLNPGHGTATLALLAGKEVDLQYTAAGSSTNHTYKGVIGGAPDAKIVPVRIGGVFGSVVQIYSSNMAKGLHHALGTSVRPPCDVVSLSHGGLPTMAWVDEINRLYDAGIVVAAASGDSISAIVLDIATHFTIYPSAWWRVITVTGETFARQPYTTTHPGEMQGSWGPPRVMEKALGAATPNVPWMRLGGPTAWGMNGAGTSASTPQVAAACALWLSKYGTSLENDWRRVAACRKVLFDKVTDRELDVDKIGVGSLDAAGMLDETLSLAVVADAKLARPTFLKRIDPDCCSWPFLRLLFGLPPPGRGVDEMLEVEAQQVAYRSRNPLLQEAIQTYPEGVGIPGPLARTLQQQFLSEPEMSRTLRTYLARHLAGGNP
jgi:subtilisin family serine protease